MKTKEGKKMKKLTPTQQNLLNEINTRIALAKKSKDYHEFYVEEFVSLRGEQVRQVAEELYQTLGFVRETDIKNFENMKKGILIVWALPSTINALVKIGVLEYLDNPSKLTKYPSKSMHRVRLLGVEND